MARQTNKQQEKSFEYSRHLFLWTFQYKTEKGKGTKDYFSSIKQKGWTCGASEQTIDARARYALWQYMSGEARKVFADFAPDQADGAELCRIYHLNLQPGKKNSYVITKDNIRFELAVDALELHLYAFGFGLVILHTSNRNYPKIEDVKKIADYGRRLYLPFIPDNKDGFIITADQLSLTLNDEQSSVDFREQINEYLASKQIPVKECFFMKYIEVSGIVSIIPQIDDRMFEIELIRDQELVDELVRAGSGWREDDALLRKLYALTFVDCGGASCDDTAMLRELMVRSVYPRWIGSGTLYSVTEYSMLCVTTHEPSAASYLTQYLYMLSLALAQRSGLFQFAEQSGKCSLSKKELSQIKKEYDQFCLNLMISRFSDQDQGVELYRMLLEQLGTSRYQETVRQQIGNTLETAAAELQNTINKRIAIFGVILTAIPFFEIVKVIVTAIFFR